VGPLGSPEEVQQHRRHGKKNERTFDSTVSAVDHSLTTVSGSNSLAIRSKFVLAWCGRRDSNSHGLGPWALN